ncbi:MAG TPA: pitrilysin family protein [Streptosporangiaceae bacterium]|nr:pitrilysin family protein [Streptosporangiaceae bacterium]
MTSISGAVTATEVPGVSADGGVGGGVGGASLAIRSQAGARAFLLRDPARPLVATSLRFAVGSARDPAGLSGLAHVLEHMMFCGTRRFGRGGHLQMIQSIGGFANATTSADWTRHFNVVPADLITILLDLEAERLVQAPEAMTEAALDIERDVVLSERRERVESAPYGAATAELLAALYPADSPNRWLPVGSAEDVGRMQLGDCLRFHADHYVAPNVNLSLVGDFDPWVLAEPVTALLDTLGAGSPGSGQAGQAGGAGQAGQGSCEGVGAVRDLLVTRRIEIASALPPKLFIGCLLPVSTSWDFELARFAGLCLGRGVSARLSERLIRSERVATAVQVKTMARAGYASAGIIEITPVDGMSASQVIDRLDAALADSVDGGLTEADLIRTKAMYRSSWLADDDTFIGRSDSLSLAMQLNGSADAYFGHDARISQINLDQLRSAVLGWHQPDHRVELVYSP